MEFPTLGKQCHKQDCKRLDFLPMTCDACSQIFCDAHIHYTTHSCSESYKKDNQVPVCPLCNKPIPIKKGEVADSVVGRHIDNDCQSDPAKEKRKVYTNKCSLKGCKVKEMIPVKCDKCHKNYCLRHRHEDDHECQGYESTGQGMSHSGAAAMFRFGNNSKQSTSSQPKSNKNAAPQQRTNHSLSSGLGNDLNRARRERQQQQTAVPARSATSQSSTEKQLRAAQAGLSDEELMARAIQQSLSSTEQSNQQDQNQTLSQEDEDRMLAQALAASEEEARRRTNTNTQRQQSQDNKKSCQVS